ncbi:hypothetical protein D3C76_515720 [compost metagenome]
MEEHQLHIMVSAHLHQVFLGAILSPGSGQGTGVFGRVGISDHHFLRTGQAVTVITLSE